MKVSKLMGVLFIASVVVGIIVSLPDIRRYIRISTM